MKTPIVPILVGITSIALITACKKNSEHARQPKPHNTGGWTSSQAAAADSVEGQLRSEGKTWTKTTGEIKAGAYVQDILEGRLNQPDGRGAIGKVISVSKGDNGQLVAMVDFGRGYRVNVQESELSLVNIE